MSVSVLFNGYPHSKPGHTYATKTVNPPPREYEVKDDNGNKRTETAYGWELGETLTFDAAFAEAHGRPSAKDGADFARLFVESENIGFENAKPKPFEIVTTKTTSADAGKGTK
jgi:hypothetical protein